MSRSTETHPKIRYAVAGLGHIAQTAVLPAFQHAKNAELVALISRDRQKLEVLGKKYGVQHCVGYEDYDRLLASGAVDAVYIAVPNDLHKDFTLRAARAGVHVLCEKPMAVNVAECREMITACENAGVKLMIAYRLHFEEANLTAIERVKNGDIGEPRYFDSAFSFQVKEGDIRLAPLVKGGGPVHDIGVYCINAVRHLFDDEPIAVSAIALSNNDPRFQKAPEMVAVTLKFPDHRLAQFMVSFGSEAVAHYRIVGTKGLIALNSAYEYTENIELECVRDGKTEKKSFKKRDQFAPELIAFADCIREDRTPEPDGNEGLADVQIVEGIWNQ